jgi:hypothetical protein
MTSFAKRRGRASIICIARPFGFVLTLGVVNLVGDVTL